MSKYTFPCKREDIEKCCDINQFKEWKKEFETQFLQVDVDYGSIENAPEKLRGFLQANLYNLQNIDRRITQISKPVSSAAALKRFHDKVRELLPDQYSSIVKATLLSLGREDADWNETIKPKKPKFTKR